MNHKFTYRGVHLPAFILTLVATALLAWGGFMRFDFDTDIVGSLPTDDPVIRDAVHLFKHHPLKDRITIDVGLERPDPQRLMQIGLSLEKALLQNPLFAQVGFQEMQEGLPELVIHTATHLPQLFSAADLEAAVKPKLTQAAIHSRLLRQRQQLAGMDAIGQYRLLALDPLGLREIVLARLSSLAPTGNVRMLQGRLISMDGRHTLTAVVPAGSATDTRLAARIEAALKGDEKDLKAAFDTPDNRLTLTVVGAHRAALDNETIVKADVHQALLLATLGIALLLLFAFPRPWVGLMALLPALGGTAAAFFTLSLFRDTISLLVLGFGGAIISITVDHGICYLLFLDRPEPTSGRSASHEVWSVGLLAALTTVGAFATLGLSGFAIFVQLGTFTALGIGYAFIFVHTIFPIIFPRMPAARTRRPLLLHRLADRFARCGKSGLVLVLLLGGVLLFFARPDFNTELDRMNTVSRETLAAEAALQNTWGNLFDRVYILLEAPSLSALQDQSDKLLAAMEQNDQGTAGFTAAEVFPGSERLAANQAAWRKFWTPRRRGRVVAALAQSAAELGFTADAFAPFIRQLTAPSESPGALTIPPSLQRLLQISFDTDSGTWRHFVALRAADLHEGVKKASPRDWGLNATVFDPQGFARHLGELLFSIFTRMLAVIGAVVIILLLLFFADLKLTAIALLPLIFAFIATLGTLGLLGHHLDLPGLMLAIVVFGMGIDYTLFFIRSYQRYQSATAPRFTLVRTAVLMASASTLVGFGVMATAHHALLRSVGLTSALGIGYCLLGAFLILPPLMDRHVARRAPAGTLDTDARVRARYRSLEAYPRLFARFKLQCDPLFTEIRPLLPEPAGIKTILDIGSGYGVPANWLAERFPGARVYGLEPLEDRVRVANFTLNGRGRVVRGGAPQIPAAPDKAQLATLLDMTHYLTDTELALTLQRLRGALTDEGQVLIRSVIPPAQRRPLLFWIEDFKLRRQGFRAHYRSHDALGTLFNGAGFQICRQAPSGTRGELAWFDLRPIDGRVK